VRPEILDLGGRIVFFPVRHHSPAAARVVRALVADMRPSAVLVEGPSDFNERVDELFLPHKLPVAIYSYFRTEGGARRSAYYPFCVYSPEWQAIQAARAVGAEVRFVDLPWCEMADDEAVAHRYADGELRASDYLAAVCRAAHVEDFDAFWDLLAEVDGALDAATYLERCHAFCYHARVADTHVPEGDVRREAFMAAEIARAAAEIDGRLLVVTGGFHSYALFARLNAVAFDHGDAPDVDPAQNSGVVDRGIALTPYSYERLDSLTGYESGMPNPGFYHRVWEDRARGVGDSYRGLLALAVKELRRRGQTASTADLIAVETTARALAALRGHAEVWRRDLVDAIVGALVKEDLAYGVEHPFLAAVHAVLRGGERGRLAEGTRLPPLVEDIRNALAERDLEPTPVARFVDLDLATPDGIARSRTLHRLRVLGVAGFAREAGADLVSRDDLKTIWERWKLQWTPELEGSAIEAAVYGPTLADAAAARLLERGAETERDAERAALLLLDAFLMGLDDLTDAFSEAAAQLIRTDNDFASLSRALGHLLYLYRYDEVLGSSGRAGLGALVAEAYRHGLWLLETLGRTTAKGDRDATKGVAVLLRTFETTAGDLDLGRDAFVETLGRVAADEGQSVVIRGAAVGCLFSIGEVGIDAVLDDVRAVAEPERLGDFLSGLFALAREAAQRHPALVASVDDLLLGFDEDQFLEALPALRLAFSYFTPREKHHMVRTLLDAKGQGAAAPLAALEVDAETAARVHAFEEKLFRAVARYGLRGMA
jgi:hypothetical protein